jgi:hypothetical protein
MLIVMMKAMRKELDEVLQENARNDQSIFEPDLSQVDDDIVTVFHSNDTLETITKKTESDIGIVQLLELMGEPFPRLMRFMLQQGVSQEPIWEPIKNLAFWYHEGMQPTFGCFGN